MVGASTKIRKLLKEMERESAVTEELRDLTKTEGGRLTPFGVGLIRAAAEHGVPQAAIARILGISPAAVSRRYGEEEE